MPTNISIFLMQLARPEALRQTKTKAISISHSGQHGAAQMLCRKTAMLRPNDTYLNLSVATLNWGWSSMAFLDRLPQTTK